MPVGVVTLMATVPLLALGAIAVMEVAELTEKDGEICDGPNVTEVTPTKPEPVIVTADPLAPADGEMADTAGSVPLALAAEPSTTTAAMVPEAINDNATRTLPSR